MVDDRTLSERRRDGYALQAIEGNPLTDAEQRMFEMFDRLGWSAEQRRSHILSLVKKKTPVPAE